MTVDDALNYLVAVIKEGKSGRNGYDVYLQDVIDKYLIERERLNRDAGSGYPFRDRGIALSPLFYSAGWELCRRGVLRPGVRDSGYSGVGHNEFGAGYSLTEYGAAWIRRADYETLASVIPGRFAELLAPHEERFGQAFLARGLEAVRCYSAHAFLASCVMCGAAGESVVLALACEERPAADVWKTYDSAGGRGKIIARLLGQCPDQVKREFQGFAQLMNYWRDEAAHGGSSKISEVEAFTSLMLLLRFARYANDVFVLKTSSF